MSAAPDIRVSAVLIVKNEQDKLGECLASLAWADEIVVLDSGSHDETCAIARAAGARVKTTIDWQGFGVQRQRAEALATGDWIFVIDADERVPPELAASIQQAVLGGPAIYELNRLSWCFGRYMRHTDMYPDWIPRLYPRGQAGFDETLVHERLRNPAGLPVKRLTGDLLHEVYDSVGHLMRKSTLYAEHWAADRARRGQTASLAGACLHGFASFIRMYVLRRGFLDGGPGLLIALVMSHATFVKYADLWARTRTSKRSND